MSPVKLGLFAGLFLAGIGTLPASGQIRVSMESSRSTYLLFEPIVFSVTLTNTTSSPLALNDHPVSGRPWLTFQIFRADGSKVMPVSGYSVPPQVLRPGETKILDVNITPLYRVRDTGPYDIRAVVNLAGRQSFQTGRLRFVVGKGEETWTVNREVDGEQRRYSLIRFLEREDSNLYIRVEEPANNTVYSTVRLGTVVGYTRPQVQFDAEGNLHVLHINTAKLHRYSRISPDGQVLEQEDRSAAGTAPTLISGNDGSVEVAGGINMSEKPTRRKLSEDQMGL